MGKGLSILCFFNGSPEPLPENKIPTSFRSWKRKLSITFWGQEKMQVTQFSLFPTVFPLFFWMILVIWDLFYFLAELFFSSTGRGSGSLCQGPLSVVCPSIRLRINFFFKHLLRNYISDFDEISHKYSCHGPLQNF